MRVVIFRGRVIIRPFLLGGVFICSFEGCSEDSMYLFFSFFLDKLFLYMSSCTYLFIYIDVCFSFTYPFMCCFFSPLIHMFLIFVCNLLFLFHIKMP